MQEDIAQDLSLLAVLARGDAGSLRIGLTFVFNDVTDRDGLGQFSDSRLRQTYDLVAKTQQLDPALDPKGFVDGRFAPKSGS